MRVLVDHLGRISRVIAQGERWVAAGLVAIITLLILVNVVTRALGMAIYWIDELAIYALVWSILFGFSVSVHERTAVAVTLLPDLSRDTRWYVLLLRLADLAALVFALALLLASWLWFDLWGLWVHGFDVGAFQLATMNFIYAEPTNTLGISKVWVWLVLPVVGVTMTLHALNNLCTVTGREGGR